MKHNRLTHLKSKKSFRVVSLCLALLILFTPLMLRANESIDKSEPLGKSSGLLEENHSQPENNVEEGNVTLGQSGEEAPPTVSAGDIYIPKNEAVDNIDFNQNISILFNGDKNRITIKPVETRIGQIDFTQPGIYELEYQVLLDDEEVERLSRNLVITDIWVEETTSLEFRKITKEEVEFYQQNPEEEDSAEFFETYGINAATDWETVLKHIEPDLSKAIKVYDSENKEITDKAELIEKNGFTITADGHYPIKWAIDYNGQEVMFSRKAIVGENMPMMAMMRSAAISYDEWYKNFVGVNSSTGFSLQMPFQIYDKSEKLFVGQRNSEHGRSGGFGVYDFKKGETFSSSTCQYYNYNSPSSAIVVYVTKGNDTKILQSSNIHGLSLISGAHYINDGALIKEGSFEANGKEAITTVWNLSNTPYIYDTIEGTSISIPPYKGEQELKNLNIVLVQTLSMQEGSRSLDMNWHVENRNTADEDSVEVNLYYHADTYFSGDDRGFGGVSLLDRYVYVQKDDASAGMMILKNKMPDSGDIKWYYYSGYYGTSQNMNATNYTGNSQIAKGKNSGLHQVKKNDNLENIAYPEISKSKNSGPDKTSKVDMGYDMQWEFTVKANSEQDISAGQQWTNAGLIQIAAPSAVKMQAGAEHSLEFTLINLDGEAKKVNLNAIVKDTANWTVEINDGNVDSNGNIMVPSVYDPVTEGKITLSLLLKAADTAPVGSVTDIVLKGTYDGDKEASGMTSAEIEPPKPAYYSLVITDSGLQKVDAITKLVHLTETSPKDVKFWITNEQGADMNIKGNVNAVASGAEGEYSASISLPSTTLNVGQKYFLYTQAEAVAGSPIRQPFFLNGLSITPHEDIWIKGGQVLDYTAEIATADDTLKEAGVSWALDSELAELSASDKTSAKVKGVSDGKAVLTAKAVNDEKLKSSVNIFIDTIAPNFTQNTLEQKSGTTYKITLAANDSGSGLKAMYYKVSKEKPTFDPSGAGWKQYTQDSENIFDVSGITPNERQKVWVVAIDKVGNISEIKQSDMEVIYDTQGPVLTLPDIHKLTSSGELNFPWPEAKAVDNVDGEITLQADHVDKTSVPIDTFGHKTVKYTVSDKAGNTTVDSQNVYIHGLLEIPVSPKTIELLPLEWDNLANGDFSILSSLETQLDKTPQGVAVKVNDATKAQPVQVNVTRSFDSSAGRVTYHAEYTYPGDIGRKETTEVVTVTKASGTLPTQDTVNFFQEKSPQLKQDELMKKLFGEAVTVVSNGLTIEMDTTQGAPSTTDFNDITKYIGKHKVSAQVIKQDGSKTYGSIYVAVYGPIKAKETLHTFDAFKDPYKNFNQELLKKNDELLVYDAPEGKNQPAVVLKRYETINGIEQTQIPLDTSREGSISYLASYPESLLSGINDASLFQNKFDTTLLVHPGITINTTKEELHFRTSDISAQELKNKIETETGITAKLELLKDSSSPYDITDRLKWMPDPIVNTVGYTYLSAQADYTLNEGEENSVSTTAVKDGIDLLVHGHITTEQIGEIVLSKDIKNDNAKIESILRKLELKAKIWYAKKEESIRMSQEPTTRGSENIEKEIPLFTESTGWVSREDRGDKAIFTFELKDNEVMPTEYKGKLAPVTERVAIVVRFSDEVVGTAPVISGTSLMNWLDGYKINREELMHGVNVADAEDGNMNDKTEVTLTNQSGTISVAIDNNAEQTLDTGVWNVEYKVTDSSGNTVKKAITITVHSPLNVSPAKIEEKVRYTGDNPEYTPMLDTLQANYTDGAKGLQQLATQSANRPYINLEKESIDITSVHIDKMNIMVEHPAFPNGFTSPTGKTKVDTKKVLPYELWAYGPIKILNTERYNSKGDNNTFALKPTTYFVQGDTLNETILKEGVEIWQEVPVDGGAPVSEQIPSQHLSIKLASKDTSKPRLTEVIYFAEDPLFTNLPKIEKPIQVKIDGKVEFTPDTGTTLYAYTDTTAEEIIRNFGVKAQIRYGNTPDVLSDAHVTDIILDDNAGTLTIKAQQKFNPQNKSTATYNVVRFGKPEFSTDLASGNHIDLFVNEYSEKQLVKNIGAKVTFTNPTNDQVEVKDAAVNIDNVNLAHGGVYKAEVSYKDSYTGQTLYYDRPVYVYVLNRAYLAYDSPQNYTVEKNEQLPSDKLKRYIGAKGIGERPDFNTQRIFAEEFPVEYDFREVDFKYFGPRDTPNVKIAGRYSYRNQDVSGKMLLTLKKESDGSGSNVPDGTPQLPGGGGITGGDQGSGSGGSNSVGTSFWAAANKLLNAKDNLGETWKITSKDFKAPKKLNDRASKVVAVPNELLDMPRYIQETLASADQMRLRIETDGGRWFFDNGGKLKTTARDTYSLRIDRINNDKINRLVKKEHSEQFKLGTIGGFATPGYMSVEISNSNLKDKTLYFYYYNDHTNTLEYIDQMESLNNNWYAVKLNGHYGQYVVSDILFVDSPLKEEIDTENPNTGGPQGVYYVKDLIDEGTLVPSENQGKHLETANYFYLLWLLAIVPVLAVITLWRKKQKHPAAK